MLRKGQTFMLNGDRWKVVYVNQSRAHCVCLTTRTVTVADARTGGTRTFTARKAASLDISPNAELDLLREMAVTR